MVTPKAATLILTSMIGTSAPMGRGAPATLILTSMIGTSAPMGRGAAAQTFTAPPAASNKPSCA